MNEWMDGWMKYKCQTFFKDVTVCVFHSNVYCLNSGER